MCCSDYGQDHNLRLVTSSLLYAVLKCVGLSGSDAYDILGHWQATELTSTTVKHGAFVQRSFDEIIKSYDSSLTKTNKQKTTTKNNNKNSNNNNINKNLPKSIKH